MSIENTPTACFYPILAKFHVIGSRVFFEWCRGVPAAIPVRILLVSIHCGVEEAVERLPKGQIQEVLN